MHPDLGISSVAIEIVNSFVIDMLERIAMESTNLLTNVDHITLTVRDLEYAVRMCLWGEVSKYLQIAQFYCTVYDRNNPHS